MNLAPCKNSLCYNGGYCDDDGKGVDGCVCINGWLGDDCRARKRKFQVFCLLRMIFYFKGSCGTRGPICYNNGKCVLSSSSTSVCQCEYPWSGPTCEER